MGCELAQTVGRFAAQWRRCGASHRSTCPPLQRLPGAPTAARRCNACPALQRLPAAPTPARRCSTCPARSYFRALQHVLGTAALGTVVSIGATSGSPARPQCPYWPPAVPRCAALAAHCQPIPLSVDRTVIRSAEWRCAAVDPGWPCPPAAAHAQQPCPPMRCGLRAQPCHSPAQCAGLRCVGPCG